MSVRFQLLDYAGCPDVVRFLYRRFHTVDCRRLEGVLLSARLRNWHYDSDCDDETSIMKWIRLRTGKRSRFPMMVGDEVPVTVRSLEELLVWLGGHEVWHFMCQTHQMRSEEEDEELDADRNGRDWLRRWRKLQAARRRRS